MLQPSKYPWYLCLAALLTAVSFLFPTASQAGLKLYKAKESEASFESGGKKIKVWQFTPKEGDGPFPGIIVLYGIDCLDELPKTELLYKNVAGKIADSGYVVHMVHYFNCTPLDPKDATAVRKSLWIRCRI